MNKYLGKRIFEGIAIGKIIRFQNKKELKEKKFLSIENEICRFHEARQHLINDFKKIYEAFEKKSINIEKEVILSHIAILDDLDFIEIVERNITDKKIIVENAIIHAANELKKILMSLDNEYLQQRTKDIDDVCWKLINNLQGNNVNFQLYEPAVIVADEMDVSSLLEIDKTNLKGIIFENISPNAHIAILTRSLGIPSISLMNNDINILDDEEVILDATEAILIVSPTQEQLTKYENLLSEKEIAKQSLEQYKNKDIKTIDGKKLKVFANITSSYEVDSVITSNADGIGLFRSEFIYLNNHDFPTEEEQFEHYKMVVSKMKDKPTIIRTFDIGADKQVDYFNLVKETNPALGYRGVRLYNEFYDTFFIQMKALFRASIYGNLKILIPMISDVKEIKFVIQVIENVKHQLKVENKKFREKIDIGIMIETAAAAITCEEFVQYVDFFSIGTNDLSQYVLAVDRENVKLSQSYNTNHKAILRLINYVCNVAKENHIPVGICGEMARDKNLLSFFVKCGVEEISVSASYVLECKKNISLIDTTNENIKTYIG